MSREQPTRQEYVREAILFVITLMGLLCVMWLRGQL